MRMFRKQAVLQLALLWFVLLPGTLLFAAEDSPTLLEINTRNCDMGHLLPVTAIDIRIFDFDKAQNISQLLDEIAVLEHGKETSQSISDLLKKMEALKSLTKKTVPLLEIKKTKGVKTFATIPPVKKILAISFRSSEFDAYVFAAQVVDVNMGATTPVLLDFSATDDCGAKGK